MKHSLAAVRALFLDYFQEHHHTLFASASLVPLDDDSLLFINAGMAPLKNFFTHPADPRIPTTKSIVSVQRCMRVSGKHNDLSNIGFSDSHHTFFEMGGNFSFGAYDRAHALRLAYNFLTHILAIPAQKLCFSVMQNDHLTKQLWQQIAGSAAHIFEDTHNFWSMGPVGPCGPCTEIYYRNHHDQLIEIWNIVFMEFTQVASGERLPLSVPCIDTGFGLERLTAVLQGVDSNYEIDVFQALARTVIHHLGVMTPTPLHVLLDHLRAAVFLMHDGVLPSNIGRGYVLRRIIRRALSFTYNAGFHQPFLAQLLPDFIATMQTFYPDLAADATQEIISGLGDEEHKFMLLRQKQLPLLTKTLAAIKAQNLPLVPGQTVFNLYDTHGLSLDHIEDTASVYGLQLDLEGYKQYMDQQQQQSRRAIAAQQNFTARSEFIGYTTLSGTSTILALYDEQDQPVTELKAPAKGKIILEQTPFYAEAGGQVGDIGTITTAAPNDLFQVLDVQKRGQAILHIGQVLKGTLTLQASVQTQVDAQARQNASIHHTATHLLFACLGKILGPGVKAKGSCVQRDRLRLDFTIQQDVSQAQLDAIEAMMNALITQALPTTISYHTYAEAVAAHVGFLDDRQYRQDRLRVLTIGHDVSCEACCGTHVLNTGAIGIFKIMKYTSIAAGVKRIEAIGGHTANLKLMQQYEAWLKDAMAALNLNAPGHILSSIHKLQQSLAAQKKQFDHAQEALFTFYTQALRIQDKVVFGHCPQLDSHMLKQKVMQLCHHFPEKMLILTDDRHGFYLATGYTAYPFTAIVSHLKTTLGLKGGIHKHCAVLVGASVTLEHVVHYVAPYLG